MKNLKSCPFCGNEYVVVDVYDPYDGYQGRNEIHVVTCCECFAKIERRSKKEAIYAWNRRMKP